MTTTSTAATNAPAADLHPRNYLHPRPVVSAGAYCDSCGAAYGYGCC